MRSWYRRALAPLVSVALWSCSSVTDPLNVLQVAIQAAPLSAAPGDTVRFVASATNPTDQRFLPPGCGPVIDVRIVASDVAYSVTDGLVFLCPLTESAYVEPHETKTLTFSWVVPAHPGHYTVVAGVPRRDALSPSSAAHDFTIR